MTIPLPNFDVDFSLDRHLSLVRFLRFVTDDGTIVAAVHPSCPAPLIPHALVVPRPEAVW